MPDNVETDAPIHGDGKSNSFLLSPADTVENSLIIVEAIPLVDLDFDRLRKGKNSFLVTHFIGRNTFP